MTTQTGTPRCSSVIWTMYGGENMDVKEKLNAARQLPEGVRSTDHAACLDDILEEIALEIVTKIVLRYNLTVDEVAKTLFKVDQVCKRIPLAANPVQCNR